MDEVLITIYGFALGTDMNTIVNKMQICLVSRHFKILCVLFSRISSSDTGVLVTVLKKELLSDG